MNELGQMLREARESQGISLAEAEAQTRIRQKFIAALEAEDWSLLPNEVTTRGFLRKYASYLGVDEDAVLEQFQSRAKLPAPEPVVVALAEREADYRPIEMDLSPPPKRETPWGWIGAAIVLLALIAAALYIYFYQPNLVANLLALPRSLPSPAQVVGPESTATPTATVQVNRVTATPTATPEFAVTDTPTPTPTEPPGEAETPEAAPASTATPTVETPAFRPVERIELVLDLLARSWTRVIVDGSLALEAVLEPGEQRTFEATEAISLRTGNAAGVQVTLNGQTLPALGGPGEVVEVIWRLVDGQIVQATPVPPPPPETPTPEAPSDG
jgi:cytoskeleton protein RodZ